MSKEVIICVDDEQIVLNSLNTQLRHKYGGRYKLEFAESGEEALLIIEELMNGDYTIVFIISDQIMPGVTGDQFLIDIHKKHPRPIKVLLTGQAGLESAVNAINHANLFRYMLKPWDEADLLLTIEKGLKEYYLMLELERQCEKLAELNAANERFVPREFLQTLNKGSITEVKLGDQIEGEMTVFFSDIRAYTTLSEGMTPTENFNFINGYLRRTGPIIRENQGFVNQFLGDGIMAIFPQTPQKALSAAVEIQRKLVEYNIERAAKNRSLIQIGVGLHTGYLMLGIIGDEQRLDTGIISDTVNTASRIEGLTKQFGARIIISQTTLTRLHDPTRFNYRFLGKVQVIGKNESIGIYEVFDGDPEAVIELKLKTQPDFSSGLEYFFAKNFAMAIVSFKNVLQRNPDDRSAQRYLEQAARFVVNGTPEGWEGAEKLDRK